MKNFFLYIIVFIGGASVLAIEILGTRILGPFYGVSLFLWSALITVTLIALSIRINGTPWSGFPTLLSVSPSIVTLNPLSTKSIGLVTENLTFSSAA